MGPVDSLIIWCYITLSLLPGVPEHSSWKFKGGLSRTFVVTGPSLSLYRSWKMLKISDFSSSNGVMQEPMVDAKSSSLGSW